MNAVNEQEPVSPHNAVLLLVVDRPYVVVDACGRFEPQPSVATVSRLTQAGVALVNTRVVVLDANAFAGSLPSPSPQEHQRHLDRLARSREWAGQVLPELERRLLREPEHLRLALTSERGLRYAPAAEPGPPPTAPVGRPRTGAWAAPRAAHLPAQPHGGRIARFHPHAPPSGDA